MNSKFSIFMLLASFTLGIISTPFAQASTGECAMKSQHGRFANTAVKSSVFQGGKGSSNSGSGNVNAVRSGAK